ncbi:MAG: hypothetical protein ABI728_14640, partial [Betaproteobacteria bacterium]
MKGLDYEQTSIHLAKAGSTRPNFPKSARRIW